MTDLDVAQALFDAQLAELVAKRQKQAGVPQTRRKETTLAALVRDHLLLKAKAGQTSHAHLVDLEIRLGAAVEYFGAHRNPRDVRLMTCASGCASSPRAGAGRSGRTAPSATTSTRSAGFTRERMSSWSWMPATIRWPPWSRSPAGGVAAPRHRPSRFHEAALLLEAARVVEKRNRLNATPALYAIVATFLLTGGGKSEVLGLDVEDVSFDRGLVYFHPNAHRGLKTKTSRRDVPLWPQLRQILQEWLYGGEQPRTTGLLFPALRALAAAWWELE